MVDIYWNSRKKLFSVRKAGLVISHVSEFVLDHVELRVSESGRQRVIASGRKNVHAVLRGVLRSQDVESGARTYKQLRYNPVLSAQFICCESGRPVTVARSVIGTTNNGKPTIQYRGSNV